MKEAMDSQLLKASILMSIVDDEESRHMIHHEYDIGSDMIDIRFNTAVRAGDITGWYRQEKERCHRA